MAALSNTGKAVKLLHCVGTPLVVKKRSGFSTTKCFVLRTCWLVRGKIAGRPSSIWMWHIATWLCTCNTHVAPGLYVCFSHFQFFCFSCKVSFVRKRIRAARNWELRIQRLKLVKVELLGIKLKGPRRGFVKFQFPEYSLFLFCVSGL